MNKFDPNIRETTREEKMRVESEEYENDDDDDDESMEHIQDNHEEETEDASSSTAASTTPTPDEKDNSNHESTHNNNNESSSSLSNSLRIEQLRAKLRAKIEAKRLHRPGGTSDTMVSKRAARRAEKKRKMELAKKKLQQSSSGGKTYTGKTTNKITIVDADKVHESLLGGSKINNPSDTDNVDNDLSGIDFGGIAGLKSDLSVSGGKYSEVNKSLKNKGKKKSLEKLLAAAEAKKERLRQLKESDDLEDKEKAKKLQWGDTLKAAR